MSNVRWYGVYPTGQVTNDWNQVKGLKNVHPRRFSSSLEARAYAVTGEIQPIIPDQACYADGSAMGDRAGVGVWFGERDPRNVSEPLLLDGAFTNNRAELWAIHRALDGLKSTNDTLTIYTDSSYAIKALTQWAPAWKRNHWRKADGTPVLNRDIIEPLTSRLKQYPNVQLSWVRGHCKNYGNEQADALAKQGTEKYKSK